MRILGLEGQVWEEERRGGGEGGWEEGGTEGVWGQARDRPLGRLDAHTLQSRETPESNQGRGWGQVER